MKSGEPSTNLVDSSDPRRSSTTRESSSPNGRPALITAAELSRLLGIRLPQVYRLARDGILPSVRLGRLRLFDPAAIEEFIRRGGAAFAHGWRKKVSS